MISLEIKGTVARKLRKLRNETHRRKKAQPGTVAAELLDLAIPDNRALLIEALRFLADSEAAQALPRRELCRLVRLMSFVGKFVASGGVRIAMRDVQEIVEIVDSLSLPELRSVAKIASDVQAPHRPKRGGS